MYTVYVLVDPRTHLIRYVGQTVHFLGRLHKHQNGKAGGHRGNWIRTLIAEGLNCEGIIVEEGLSNVEADEWEQRWIALGRASGWPLTNLTDGGGGASGYVFPEEVKAKISANNRIALKGRKISPEWRSKLREAAKKWWATRSPEQRAQTTKTWGRRGKHGTSDATQSP